MVKLIKTWTDLLLFIYPLLVMEKKDTTMQKPYLKILRCTIIFLQYPIRKLSVPNPKATIIYHKSAIHARPAFAI